MVDHSAENKDIQQLIALAIKFHGIDVPVHAIRQDGDEIIIVVQGGVELQCKMDDLLTHHRGTEITEKKRELKRFESDKKKSHIKK